MLVKIYWGKLNPVGWHVYQCTDYFVNPRYADGYPEKGTVMLGATITLDGGKHDIIVGEGDLVYFMNDNGKTIDSILL